MDSRRQQALNIQVKHLGDAQVVFPKGSIMASNIQEFSKIIENLCAQDRPHILVDCAELAFINSTGLGTLYKAHRTCHTQQGSFALCSVSPKIRTILQLLGLEKKLRLFTHREEALAYWNEY